MSCLFVLFALSFHFLFFKMFVTVSCPHVKRLCVFRKALYKFELLLLLFYIKGTFKREGWFLGMIPFEYIRLMDIFSIGYDNVESFLRPGNTDDITSLIRREAWAIQPTLVAIRGMDNIIETSVCRCVFWYKSHPYNLTREPLVSLQLSCYGHRSCRTPKEGKPDKDKDCSR